jgi:DNA-binding NarL/FixJ family response regulator
MKEDLSRLAPAIISALSVRRRLERVTPRQLQVLQLVAEGHSTREIARRLKLSVKTVETHRGEMMKRLGIHDVVALVRYAVRVGLGAPSPEPGGGGGSG